MNEQSPPPPSPRDARKPGRGSGSSWPRWSVWVVLGLLAAMFVVPPLFRGDGADAIAYSEFIERVDQEQVRSITVDNTTGDIRGETTTGDEFTTTGPAELPQTTISLLERRDVDVKFETPQPGLLGSLLPFLIPLIFIVGF